jgi:hypothetical protein
VIEFANAKVEQSAAVAAKIPILRSVVIIYFFKTSLSLAGRPAGLVTPPAHLVAQGNTNKKNASLAIVFFKGGTDSGNVVPVLAS